MTELYYATKICKCTHLPLNLLVNKIAQNIFMNSCLWGQKKILEQVSAFTLHQHIYLQQQDFLSHEVFFPGSMFSQLSAHQIPAVSWVP